MKVKELNLEGRLCQGKENEALEHTDPFTLHLKWITAERLLIRAQQILDTQSVSILQQNTYNLYKRGSNEKKNTF